MNTLLNKNIIKVLLIISALTIVSCKTTSKVKDYKKTIQTGDKNIPDLNGPEVRRIWMPDKIEGNKLIKGHFIYVIKKNSTWRL